jgi:hypothetical protein
MPYDDIRPVDHSCKSYRPGHRPHWIQTKESFEDGQPLIDVTVVVHGDGRVDLHGEDLDLTVWNHDPARLQSAVDSWGRAVWKPKFHVLAVPGEFGYAFSLGPAEHHSPCVREADLTPLPETASVLDRVRRDARELGGYTVRLESLQAAIAADELTGDRGASSRRVWSGLVSTDSDEDSEVVTEVPVSNQWDQDAATPNIVNAEHLDDRESRTDPVGSAGPTDASALVGWLPTFPPRPERSVSDGLTSWDDRRPDPGPLPRQSSEPVHEPAYGAGALPSRRAVPASRPRDCEGEAGGHRGAASAAAGPGGREGRGPSNPGVECRLRALIASSALGWTHAKRRTR